MTKYRNRIVGILALAAALVTQSAMANPGDPGELEGGAPQQITVVSTCGGNSFTSRDGGKSWELSDPATAAEAEHRIARSLQMTALVGLIGDLSMTTYPSSAMATISYTTLQP